MVQQLEEYINLDDNLFFLKGVRGFIKDHEDKDKIINLKENIRIKNIYEYKKSTMKFIKDKRKEYEKSILTTENKIILLSNSLRELENEKKIRLKKMEEKNDSDDILKEKIEDIIDAISENRRIINYERNKVNEIRDNYKKFNDTSLEEENRIYIFLNYIKREFNKEMRRIVEFLNSDNLLEVELLFVYEYYVLLIKKMICIEEELLGG